MKLSELWIRVKLYIYRLISVFEREYTYLKLKKKSNSSFQMS